MILVRKTFLTIKTFILIGHHLPFSLLTSMFNSVVTVWREIRPVGLRGKELKITLIIVLMLVSHMRSMI